MAKYTTHDNFIDTNTKSKKLTKRW